MSRRVLVVGGSGMIGSHIAADLAARGDRVVIAARGEGREDDPLQIKNLERIKLDYTDQNLTAQDLEGFDDIVFAAGNDIRHVAKDDENEEFWSRVQSVGVPRFAALAKEAGVHKFVQIGSYYHHLNPAWAEGNPYVAARKAADEGARALAGDGFAPITLNPPSIIGAIPGRPLRAYGRLIDWLTQKTAGPEVWAPKGGTNYMSVRSLSQAVLGALDSGEAGRAYLIGDKNWRYHEYYEHLAAAAGHKIQVEERDEEHSYLPDRFIVQGRGGAISYETDPADLEVLKFELDDVDRALQEIAEMLRANS